MFKGRSRGRGRGRGGAGTIQKVPLNVYTCQQAQPKRCNFFLWDDEAKPREAAAVLSNSRTEPMKAPETPTKPANTSSAQGLRTPYTDTVIERRSTGVLSPCTPSKSTTARPSASDTQTTRSTLPVSDEEFYDWPASDEDDVLEAVDQASSQEAMPPPETPNKAPKRDALSTPGKRRFLDMANGDERGNPSLSTPGDDVFVTPATVSARNGLFPSAYGMPSPADTPTPRRFTNLLQAGQDSELTMDVLKVLKDHGISVNSDVKAELKGICDKHALSTRGIMKGRDISRATVQAKNEKISELQESITALQAERETSRAVIRHLRRDMEMSKERPR
ncbi:MAG: hypothetical protein Q9174_000890 [Haloplaca sp. 1 TL-2023]